MRRFDAAGARRGRRGRCGTRRRRAAAAAGRPGGVGQGPVRRGRPADHGRHRGRWPTPRRPRADCPAVARLRAAGAALVGHTNMSEFAFSGVGINPHHGTPANAATAALDADAAHPRRLDLGRRGHRWRPARPGPRWARTPAARSASRRRCRAWSASRTRSALTPLTGSVPLSTTLDTACAITRSVRDAVLLHEVLAARTRARCRRGRCARCAWRVPTDADARRAGRRRWPRAFERALARAARRRRARSTTWRCPSSASSPAATPAAASRPPRAWAWHRQRLAAREADYDPRVRACASGAARRSARPTTSTCCRRARALDRAAWRRALRGFDAMLSPDRADRGAADRAAARQRRSLLRRQRAAAAQPVGGQLLDGCALSLPCQRGRRAAGRPDGLGRRRCADDAVLDVVAGRSSAALRRAAARR